MSRLYDEYLRKKRENPKVYYLFRSGLFYVFLEDDARKMAETLRLKLSPLSPEIIKCGFPVSSLPKYQVVFKNLNIEVELIDGTEEKTLCSSRSELANLLSKIKMIRLEETTPMQAFQLLGELKGVLEDE